MPKKHHAVSPIPAQSTQLTNQTETINAFIAAALTTPEAAAYLKVQPATLEQWRWNGKGPRFIKLGRSVRYRPPDLDAFMAERVFTSTTEAKVGG